MRPSQHPRRHSLPHIPTFNLGEDIDLAIGLTAGALAGNEFLESSQSHDSRASHLLKAGLSAVVAASAFKMLGREHRESGQQSRHHHHGDRIKDDDDHSSRHSTRHRVHHHQGERERGENEARDHTHQHRAHHDDRIEDEDEHRRGHHHHHHHSHHRDDDITSQVSREHRFYLREADEDQPYRRHSFESARSQPMDSERSHRGQTYGSRDRDPRYKSSSLRDDSVTGGISSSTVPPGQSGGADHGHHVHFGLPEDEH